MQNYINNYCVKSFILTCKCISFIKDTSVSIYNSHWFIKTILNELFFVAKYIYCLMISQKMEPFYSKWISKCWMTPNTKSLTQTYYYGEIYKTSSELHTEVFSPRFLLNDFVKNYYYYI